MWGSIILYTIISIIIVYISHQIWSFVINKYSKKKYLVGSQITKYKSILRELQEENPSSEKEVLEGAKDDLEEFMQTL
jgi:hypothetical protein